MHTSKRPLHPGLFLAGALFVAAAFPIGCGPCSGDDEEDSTGANDGAGAGNSNGHGGSGGGECGFSCGQGGNNGALMIVPPNATINVVDGVAMPVDETKTMWSTSRAESSASARAAPATSIPSWVACSI